MDSCKPEQIFEFIPGFEEGSKTVARAIHDKVLEREESRQAADILHGIWLEHPLHPALTDFVIGAWFFGSVLDGITLVRRSRGIQQAADILISVGNAVALPTALAGLADFSAIPPKSAKTAATHALMNAGGLAMNIASSLHRRAGKRGRGILLSAVASGGLLVSAWLGGKLSYEQKVGVNKIPETGAKGEWKPVLKERELEDQKPARVNIDEAPVLLYRSGSTVHALGAVCAHEGGPLEKGKFHDSHVTCPWHQSVYDLRDGHVVHGPSTYSEPVYETRTTDGMLEIKARQQD